MHTRLLQEPPMATILFGAPCWTWLKEWTELSLLVTRARLEVLPILLKQHVQVVFLQSKRLCIHLGIPANHTHIHNLLRRAIAKGRNSWYSMGNEMKHKSEQAVSRSARFSFTS